MLPMQPPSEKKSCKGDQHQPDLVGLILLWIFAAILGPFIGFLPPPFKPLWLYNSVLASIFAGWLALGILQLIFDKVFIGGTVFGILAIIIGAGGLGFLLLKAENGGEEKMR